MANIHDHLDLAKDKHLVFWAACLTGFFILTRKSNLVPVKDFDLEKQLATKHVKLDDEYYEYSSLGSYFYGKFRLAEIRGNSGPSNVLLVKGGLMDAQGITVQGSRMIQKRLNDKIKSANLYHRYHMLSAKLINF